MPEDDDLPAWSEPFTADRRNGLARLPPLAGVDREWAWGGADGSGTLVAIIDSGIERGHPAVGGQVRANMVVELDEEGETHVREDPDSIDVVGHGTACAAIIHSLAPAAEFLSIRVLGPDNRGKGVVFAAGLEWAIEQGASVVNLSLSSKSEAMFGTFHELADAAYFANVLLVSAANNVPGASYPSLFAAVVSVASHDVADPWTLYYNPSPPVEFGAYGLDVDVAWRDGGRIIATGNSFAAPHVAGLATLVRSKHPGITPFEVKTILAAVADNPRPRRRAAARPRRAAKE
jgi:subtilisin family serine protease